MRFLRNFIIVLLLLALVAISSIGLMIEAPAVMGHTPDRLNAWGRSAITIMRPNMGLFWFWLATWLGAILVFLITVARPRRPMKIEVQMGGGKVVILDSAIKKYIRNALSEIGEVTVKKIELHDTRNGIMTNLYADVRTRDNLPLIQRRMITRIRAALTEELGITNLADVHVFIRDFEVTGRPVRQMTTPTDTEKQPRITAAAPETDANDHDAAIPGSTNIPSETPIESVQPVSTLHSDQILENPDASTENAYHEVIEPEDTLPATDIPELDAIDSSHSSEKTGEVIDDEIVLNRPSDDVFASAAEHFSKLDGGVVPDSEAFPSDHFKPETKPETKKFPWDKE